MKETIKALIAGIIFILLYGMGSIIANNIDDVDYTKPVELKYVITQQGDTAWVVNTVKIQTHYTLTKPK